MKRFAIALVLASLGTALVAVPGAMAGGAKLKLEQSDYGKVLMNGRGKALYLFTKDKTKVSECYGEYAVAWPPFLTKGKPSVAGTGLKPNLVGTTLRDDGSRQVTYKNHPLYFYVHDKPGLIFCQDVFEYGGTWLLVNGRGGAVR